MTEILESRKRRGGTRPGAGRPRVYRDGTTWIMIPVPRAVGDALGPEPRCRVLDILRQACPDLPWPNFEK